MRKFTLKEVYIIYKDDDYELLELRYKNSHTKMKCRCPKGHIAYISLKFFKLGQRCTECSGYKKYTLEDVQQAYKDINWKLHETEYKNSRTLMKSECDKGHVFYSRFNSFLQGARCNKCVHKRLGKSKRIGLKESQLIFKKGGCELLALKYKNSQTPMLYKCSCGNISEISLASFQRGSRCRKCADKKNGKTKRIGTTESKQILKEYGYKLLEQKYKDNQTPMKSRCPNGHISYIRLHDFQQGHRCKECFHERNSGTSHWKYNPNLTDKERSLGRDKKAILKWQKEVFSRDDYTCQCHGQYGGRLVAHHIFSYSDNEELRFELSNGITLCDSCHDLFHTEYGKGYNTLEQLVDFLFEFRDDCKRKYYDYNLIFVLFPSRK